MRRVAVAFSVIAACSLARESEAQEYDLAIRHARILDVRAAHVPE